MYRSIACTYNHCIACICPVFPGDAMTSKCFLHYSPFVTAIHRPLMDSTHIIPVTRTFDVLLLLAWTSCWPNSRVAGDLGHLNIYVTCAAEQPIQHHEGPCRGLGKNLIQGRWWPGRCGVAERQRPPLSRWNPQLCQIYAYRHHRKCNFWSCRWRVWLAGSCTGDVMPPGGVFRHVRFLNPLHRV